MADEELKAYCMKCKTKKVMKDVTKTTIQARGRKQRMAKGSCGSCGTKMSLFLKGGVPSP